MVLVLQKRLDNPTFFFNHRDAATVHLETHRNHVLHGAVCDFTLLNWS